MGKLRPRKVIYLVRGPYPADHKAGAQTYIYLTPQSTLLASKLQSDTVFSPLLTFGVNFISKHLHKPVFYLLILGSKFNPTAKKAKVTELVFERSLHSRPHLTKTGKGL